ncbi:MAG: polyphosphate kinase 2 family protein [Rhodoglobus sp.]
MSTLTPVTSDFELASIDPSSTPGFDGDKKDAAKQLEHNADRLAELQERLFAESKFGGENRVLLVLQAMDTAGKGGILRHVIGGVDPQGVQIHAFKAPTDEEKSHDFLWRIRKELPTAGNIGVFDRSHYEDVLIHRVRGFSTPETVEERYGIIEEFEKELVAQGTTIIKVMLHISADEQKERLQERLDRPEKHWKYNPGDVDERLLWSEYQKAYEIAIQRTTTVTAPWYVVPANHKWYARLAVQQLLLQALETLDPQWPSADYDVETEKDRLAAS